MKYRIGAVIAGIIIASIFGFVLYQDAQSKNDHLIRFPPIEELVSADINIGGPPSPIKTPISMDFNDDMQKLLVAKILYWLSHAEYVGNAQNQFISYGGGPNEFVMKTKDGKSLSISDAFDAVSITDSTGWMTSSVSVADEVSIFYDNKTLRLKSPDLKRWIENDMSKIIEDHMKQVQ